jgi:hypothetical protein
MHKVSMTRKELEDFALNDVGFCNLDISRISSVFIAQVIQLQTNQVINTHQMLDEIKNLENVGIETRTKKVDSFKRPPLKGLKKSHFTDASFINKNLGAHFGYENGGNKRLTKVVNDAFERNGIVDDELISYLSHHAAIGSLEERAKKHNVTGEWIIFQEYENMNYYLTLAAHNEGDENIYKRVRDSYEFDFPFLHKKASTIVAASFGR